MRSCFFYRHVLGREFGKLEGAASGGVEGGVGFVVFEGELDGVADLHGEFLRFGVEGGDFGGGAEAGERVVEGYSAGVTDHRGGGGESRRLVDGRASYNKRTTFWTPSKLRC